MNIRPATDADFDEIWPIFSSIASAGETYAYPCDISKDEAHRLWMALPRETYVAENDGVIEGTYYIKSNNMGPGSHICNCGYMVAGQSRGKGLATAMNLHSQKRAQELGYRGMQFNFVVSTNTVAVKLWQKLGYTKAGVLPEAFDHPKLGFVDAFVMYKLFE